MIGQHTECADNVSLDHLVKYSWPLEALCEAKHPQYQLLTIKKLNSDWLSQML